METTALVELEVCKQFIGNKAQALEWQKEWGWMPEKLSYTTEFLYCEPLYVADLIHLDGATEIVVGTRVKNNEPPCPADGCRNAYLGEIGVVKAIFPTFDDAINALQYPPEGTPVTEYYLLSIYQ